MLEPRTCTSRERERRPTTHRWHDACTGAERWATDTVLERAGMAKPVDATDLKSVAREGVRVRVPLSAPTNTKRTPTVTMGARFEPW